jgi:hypothetical protein
MPPAVKTAGTHVANTPLNNIWRIFDLIIPALLDRCRSTIRLLLAYRLNQFFSHPALSAAIVTKPVRNGASTSQDSDQLWLPTCGCVSQTANFDPPKWMLLVFLLCKPVFWFGQAPIPPRPKNQESGICFFSVLIARDAAVNGLAEQIGQWELGVPPASRITQVLGDQFAEA